MPSSDAIAGRTVQERCVMGARRCSMSLVVCAFILLSCRIVFATVLCVNPLNPAGCYGSIQSAVNAAATGDTIDVAPGTYNEAVTIGKRIVLLGHGYETTAIVFSGPLASPAVSFGAGSASSKLSGFRVTSLTDDGVYINLDGASILISNCYICSCAKNGIYAIGSECTFIATNNVIAGNSDNGIYCYRNLYFTRPVFYSNIVYGNYDHGLDGLNFGGMLVGNCFFLNGKASASEPGSGGITQNPLFVAYPSDLHLAAGSPCIDTGFAGIDFYDCDGTRNDMGIYGGPEAFCGPGPVVKSLLLVPSTVVKGETFSIQATAQTK